MNEIEENRTREFLEILNEVDEGFLLESKKSKFFKPGWWLAMGIVLLLIGGIGFGVSMKYYSFRLLGLLIFCFATACFLIGLILTCKSAMVRNLMPSAK